MHGLKNNLEHFDIVFAYTLLFNATLMVEEGLGYAICFDHLINTLGESLLCFKSLSPDQIETYYFIW